MVNHELSLTRLEARALVNAGLLGLKGSRPIECDDETRQAVSGKLTALFAKVIEAQEGPGQ